MSEYYNIPDLPLPYDFESKAVMRQLVAAHRCLAQLHGLMGTIPNESILISTLTLQEARESSFLENIVTTQDDLYKTDLHMKSFANPAAKEVLNYRAAIECGFRLVKNRRILTCNDIKEIQQQLEHNNAGFRSVPGTMLRRGDGTVVYVPPQEGPEVERLMANLERFINDDLLCDLDPLIKMAIVHHQFESIHPFYDGNGRTGRIINILMLITSGLLDLPILYLSRYITRNKAEYYCLIQTIRDKNTDNYREWENWILFILRGVEETARDTIHLINAISELMATYKGILSPIFGRQYKDELLNNLFKHPYTKIEFMERDMMVSRQTAGKYLELIVDKGLLQKVKMGKENYYINTALVDIFLQRK